MNLPDLEIRIQQLLDDELTAEEFAKLESELLQNPEAMDLYLSYSRLQSGLQSQGSFKAAVEKMPVVPMEWILAQQRQRSIRFSLLSAAALITILVAVMWLTTISHTPDTLATVRVTPGSDFTLTHNTDDSPPIGKIMVENSRIVLHHGVIELDLPHDVRAIIEAPAEMVLLDDRTLELDHGRAYFKISSTDGQGFTVVTPHQRIVDLGTAFGIDCRKGSNEVELHVLEGRVRVDSKKGNNGEIIEAPRSVLLAGIDIKRDLDGPPAAFLENLPPKIDILLDEDFETGLIVGHGYVIRMDPTVIRDLAGNSFSGIDDESTWKFTTAGQASTIGWTEITDGSISQVGTGGNPGGYLEYANMVASSELIAPAAFLGDLSAYDGGTFSWDGKAFDEGTGGVPGSYAYGKFTVAGTAGSATHPGIPSASRPSVAGDWTGFSLDFTAADFGVTQGEWDAILADVTSITLGGNAWKGFETLGYDNFALATISAPGSNDFTNWIAGYSVGDLNGFNDDPDGDSLSNGLEAQFGTHPGQPTPAPATDMRDDSSPVFIAAYPSDDSTGVTWDGQLKMLFNKPIKFGTGRVYIQNVTDWSESTLVVGDHRLSIEDRVLTINPPIELKDGAQSLGLLAGWESSAPVIFLNPRGDGTWYNNDDLQDDRRTRGMIESMPSPAMTSIHQPIRREIGTITADSRYTVSATIGVRADDATVKSTYLGYAIRLKSGDTLLSQITSNTPPGPANSITTVGFSWDATTLPAGIQPGDPLSIEIIPNRANDLEPGYLDLNALRISVLGQAGR